MRLTLSLALLVAALGCGNNTVRLEGDGCQPACTIVAIEGGASEVDISVDCLDEDERPELCARQGEGVAYCLSGAPTCGFEGPPTCPDGSRPYCGR